MANKLDETVAGGKYLTPDGSMWVDAMGKELGPAKGSSASKTAKAAPATKPEKDADSEPPTGGEKDAKA